MFYKRKKVVHLNFKNANAAKAALAEHIFRLKFEKNMRKLFGMNKKT